MNPAGIRPSSPCGDYFFGALPPEMEEKVCTFLDHRSLCRLRQTCRSAASVAEQNSLWEKLYSERWRDLSWAESLRWKDSFALRFSAERNWDQGSVRFNVSRNVINASGFFFTAVSDRDDLFLKDDKNAVLIHKKNFQPASCLLGQEIELGCTKLQGYKKRRVHIDADRVLNAVGINVDACARAYTGRKLELTMRNSRQSEVQMLDSEAKVLKGAGSWMLAGCRDGSHYVTNTSSFTLSKRQFGFEPIEEIGFISPSLTSPNVYYSLDARQNLFVSDIECAGASSHIGKGVKKCTPAEDRADLFIATRGNELFRLSLDNPSQPSRVASCKSTILSMHCAENGLALGTMDGEAMFYDIRMTERPLMTILHNNPVLEVKTDGKKMFSGDHSGAVKYGSVERALVVRTLIEPEDYAVTSLHIDPFMLFVTRANGVIIQVDATPDRLASNLSVI